MTASHRARVERSLKRVVPEPAKAVALSAVRAYAVATSARRRLPDYLVIGAKRAGTTSLHRYLLRHPDVVPLLPAAKNIKGVHYFDRQPQRSIRWYRSHFPIRGTETLCGESSPYYMYHPAAAARAAAVVPDAKLIVLLRDPAQRAWSHYRDEVKNGRETLSFADAVAQEHARTSADARRLADGEHLVSLAHEHHTYVSQGLYAEHLRRWLSHFPPEQLCWLRSEDLFTDAAAAHRKVLAFLGLPARDLPAYEPNNASPQPRDDADRAVVAELEAFYGPHNEELSELLQAPLAWGSR